jgi:D-arabinono-1,4-lactone oxidase
VPRFHLNEVRTRLTGREAQQLLRGGRIAQLMQTQASGSVVDAQSGPGFDGHPRPAFHLELLWNVYTDNLIVTSRHPVDAALERQFEQNEPTEFSSAPPRDLFHALAVDRRYSRNAFVNWLAGALGGAPARLLEALFGLDPRAIPDAVDSGLNGLPDPQYTNRSYKVFNIGDAPNQIPALSATLSVPLRDDQYLEAMDVMRQTAQRRADEHRQYMTGPISLRFVRGSEAFLADPENVCKFEIIFGGDAAEIRQFASTLTWEFYQALYSRFHGDVRLHWGQLTPAEFVAVAPQRLRESYPRFDAWLHIRDLLDPKRRFENSWQERMFR